jgi:hypothetical protein
MVRPTEYLAMPTIVANVARIAETAPVANLTQIETDPNKAAKIAYHAPMHGQQHAPRRRERKREVYLENEPLVQIETQHNA